MRSRRLVLCSAVIALAAMRPSTTARGDYEETERRLKSGGVDDALRTRIHKAIDRAVYFFSQRQEKDGTFEEHTSGRNGGASRDRLGVTLLTTLALRHAGTRPTVPLVAKAVDWLFPDQVDAIERQVYESGIALMLLASLPGNERAARRFASALAAGIDAKTGWWGYDTPGSRNDSSYGAPPPPFTASGPNLSTTQFAALGLWAAQRKGIDVPSSVWIRHAEALVGSQTKSGSWPYLVDMPDKFHIPAGLANVEMGYTTGTYMGLANLLLVAKALETAPRAPDALRKRVAEALVRGRNALASGAGTTLARPNNTFLRQGDDDDVTDTPPTGDSGWGAYYTLYALEKACLFADVEALDVPRRESRPGLGNGAGKPKLVRTRWYEVGAKWLLERQQPSGGWSPWTETPDAKPSEIDTALALLFLVRSASAFHPTTPSDPDAPPRGAVTPGDPPAMDR